MTEIEVGRVVRGINGTQLFSGAESYSSAICCSVDPFILVSSDADMRWDRHQIENFEATEYMAKPHHLQACMRRLTMEEQQRAGWQPPSTDVESDTETAPPSRAEYRANIGDVVVCAYPERDRLRSAGKTYGCGVVISAKPFLLASEDATVRWNRLEPRNFVFVRRATAQVLTACTGLLSIDERAALSETEKTLIRNAYTESQQPVHTQRVISILQDSANAQITNAKDVLNFKLSTQLQQIHSALGLPDDQTDIHFLLAEIARLRECVAVAVSEHPQPHPFS